MTLTQSILRIAIVPAVILFIWGPGPGGSLMDFLLIQKAKSCANWIENFYTENAYYPSQQELHHLSCRFTLYNGPLNDSDASSFQPRWNHFSLKYSLFRENENAVGSGGNAASSFPGFDFHILKARYEITPCNRWATIGLDYSDRLFLVDYRDLPISPRVKGWITVDFLKGIVFFVPKSENGEDVSLKYEKALNKTVLLEGLIKPRMLADYDSDDRLETLYVTNGSEVFSYRVYETGETIGLENLGKFASVPQSCPAGYLDN